MWLPGFLVVAMLLSMADRFTQQNSITMSDRQQRDLEIEVNKSFDNYFSFSTPTSLLRIFPGVVNFRFFFNDTLPLSRRAHNRLDYTGKTHGFRSHNKFVFTICKTIRRRFDLDLFGC